jgi:hypothetical protein
MFFNVSFRSKKYVEKLQNEEGVMLIHNQCSTIVFFDVGVPEQVDEAVLPFPEE